MKAGILMLVVAISGCVLPSGFFGQDVLDIRAIETTDGVRDTLTVRDIITIPTSPLLPDRDLLLSFVVQNNDRLKEAENVRVDLFDAPLFKDNTPAKRGMLCNTLTSAEQRPCQANTDASGAPGACSVSMPCFILPGAEEQIMFNLRTFSKDEIANIKQDTTLSFKAIYDFDGSLTYVLPVVDMNEVIKRQRANERTQISIVKTHSSGPVQADVELLGAPYMLADFPSTLLFKVRNVGSGTIVNSKIPGAEQQAEQGSPGESRTTPQTLGMLTSRKHRLEIIFPPELVVKEYPGMTVTAIIAEFENVLPSRLTSSGTRAGAFSCARAEEGFVCVNTGDIDIYRDESRTSMRFVVELSDAARQQMKSQEIPFRSFQIKARVFYEYELRGAVSAAINPFENV